MTQIQILRERWIVREKEDLRWLLYSRQDFCGKMTCGNGAEPTQRYSSEKGSAVDKRREEKRGMLNSSARSVIWGL